MEAAAARANPAHPANSASRLADAFDPRNNSLNALRLLFATLVIFGHAVLVGGYLVPRPVMLTLGEVPVDGFFVISGFLISRSWTRRPSWQGFLWHRVLRIFPGFWVTLLATALIFAPIGVLLRGWPLSSYWGAVQGPWGYLWHNALLWIGQEGIAGTPNQVPYPGVWNAPLWTLYWEFLCYLGAGLLGALGVLTRRRSWLLAGMIALWLVIVARAFVPAFDQAYFSSFIGLVMPRLVLMFLIGCVLFCYSERVPMDGWFAAAAALIVLGALMSGVEYRALGAFALGYLVLWIGCRVPVRWGSRHDVSYGLYIYAFPIQQLLVIGGVAVIGWWWSGLLALALTVPLAWLSWWAVERRALAWKSRGPGGHVGTPGPGWLALILAADSALMFTPRGH